MKLAAGMKETWSKVHELVNLVVIELNAWCDVQQTGI
jgi:hypothetical protein